MRNMLLNTSLHSCMSLDYLLHGHATDQAQASTLAGGTQVHDESTGKQATVLCNSVLNFGCTADKTAS